MWMSSEGTQGLLGSWLPQVPMSYGAKVSGVTLDFRTPEEAKLEEQEASRQGPSTCLQYHG